MLEEYPRLRRIVNAILKDRRIEMAIIFGSYAKGTAKRGSDIDIFIEPRNKDVRRELKLLDSDISVKMGRFDGRSPLGREILKEHVVIKGVERLQEQFAISEKDAEGEPA